MSKATSLGTSTNGIRMENFSVPGGNTKYFLLWRPQSLTHTVCTLIDSNDTHESFVGDKCQHIVSKRMFFFRNSCSVKHTTNVIRMNIDILDMLRVTTKWIMFYNSGLKHAARGPHVARQRYLCGPRPLSLIVNISDLW